MGFGIVFATAIILVIVPCLYMIQEDAMDAIRRLREGGGVAAVQREQAG